MIESSASGFGHQKELQEITVLMHRLLQPQGIEVRTEQEGECLYVLLEAERVPQRDTMVALVKLSIDSLPNPFASRVRVYGRRIGNIFTDWMCEMVRVPAFPKSELVPEALPRGQQEFPTIASTPTVDGSINHFLICGLGSLGQHCVSALRSFTSSENEFSITAIDLNPPANWEIEQIPEWLSDRIVVGDCRRDGVLDQAGIRHCRAILIVTSDENVNLETAIAAHRLNPNVRLVARSSKQNLNLLLKQKLDDYIGLDPIELPATTFMLAALGEQTLGFFTIEGRQLQVIQHRVTTNDDRFANRSISMLQKRDGLLLGYQPSRVDGTAVAHSAHSQPDGNQGKDEFEFTTASRVFHRWRPNARVQADDIVIYLEDVEPSSIAERMESPWRRLVTGIRSLQQGNRRQKVTQLALQLWNWIYHDQTRRIGAIALLTAGFMGVLGSLLLKSTVPGMSWQSAISSAIILLLGGYGDVFGGLELLPIPWWVQLVCLLITVISLLFILSLLGLLADRLLQSRFEFLRRRLLIPEADHVVLVGLGRVGQQIARLLYNLRQPFVCLTSEIEPQGWLPQISVIQSHLVSGLDKVNLPQAKSVIVVTDDQMVNLEVALMARSAISQFNRPINLVIRTSDQRFNDHLRGFLPDAKAFCAYALSAEAFAGAAFGENILNLFRMGDQTVLVTEYQISEADTLNGYLLAQIAYGYGVVPIYYQSAETGRVEFMPKDEIRLHPGDRLIVLASINGLQRIEWGTASPPRLWQLQALKPLNVGATHYAGNILENVAGCSLKAARTFMESLPGVLSVPGILELELYDHQAYHLVQKLRKLLPVRLVAVAAYGYADASIYID
jgi:voltage-gated potassium channel Kch